MKFSTMSKSVEILSKYNSDGEFNYYYGNVEHTVPWDSISDTDQKALADLGWDKNDWNFEENWKNNNS